MGEIDAMSRMRDDETEESARIKALCPGLAAYTHIHLASPAIEDELFRLCDPAKKCLHMNATTIIPHICNCTRYSCDCDNNCMYYTQTTKQCCAEHANSATTPRPHDALTECTNHGAGWRRNHAHTIEP